MSITSSGDISIPPSEPRPEFFFDRSLGKRAAEELRSSGWVIHLIADHFPFDAQDVKDEEWISYARARGWCCLTKDHRLWRLLDDSQRVPVFALSSGQMDTAAMVTRFEVARHEIWRKALGGEVGLWVVYEPGRGIRKRYPRD